MFTQFQYCPLCRLNHKKKRKHIYSRRHQNVVDNILEKYFKKITEARDSLESPEIQNAQFERGAKFWCHFCVEEYLRHLELDTCTVRFGGLIEHIADYEHKRKMYSFFYENRVDESKRQPNLFHMSEEELKKFQEKVAISAKKFDAGKRKEIEKSAARIRIAEAVRKQMMQSQQFSKPQIIENTHSDRIAQNFISPGAVVEKKATLLAKGEGVTFIGSHTYNRNEGNIHSGAAPPWMLSTDIETTSNEIGPTMDTFKAHVEMRKKKKLPANRVGAKFDHQQSTDQSWLPSFGRVWSKGGRQQSKKYFQRMYSSKVPPTSTHPAPKTFTTTGTVSSTVTHNTADGESTVNNQGNLFNGGCSFHSEQDSNSIHFSQAAMNMENQSVSTFPSYNGGEIIGSETNSAFIARHVKPYMKKHRSEISVPVSSENVDLYALHNDFDAFQHKSQGDEDFSVMSHSSVSRNVKPYIRKRHAEETGSCESKLVDFVPVIPTPILNMDTNSSTSKLKKFS